MYRTDKRTIKTLKLTGRLVALVHREVEEGEEGLLATQILVAHADLALRPATAAPTDGPAISPARS